MPEGNEHQQGAGAELSPAQRQEQETRERIERAKHHLPEDAPQGIVKSAVAQGQPEAPELSLDEQKGALEWLLAPQRALRYDVDVEFDTPQGKQTLTFLIKQMDSDRIDAIERENIDEKTGRINRTVNQAQLVAEACELLKDATGREFDPADESFRTGRDGQRLPNAAEAFRARFTFQAGLLAGVAEQIRIVSGWGPDRVGTAQRVLVEATGNS